MKFTLFSAVKVLRAESAGISGIYILILIPNY